ncbi:MAG: RDD family protein, partial [Deltaproteobacteria bacterium]|nr:RDD family protein [Deltaproteobacteria bacterium]
MKSESIKQGNEKGVYFERHDYAGLLRRLIIVMVDLSFLILFFTIFYLIFFLSFDATETTFFIYFWLCFLSAFCYLSILKPSRYRTLGYIATSAKIVDLKGNRPSFLRMAFRFCLLILGPVFFIIDILWLTSEENRQTLRDKIAATYVIKKDAQPIGSCAQLITTYDS